MTLVKVRWAWLALVATQIVLSIIFVVVIITRTSTSGLGVVKSSLLPVLFAINSEDRALLEEGLDAKKGKLEEEYVKIKRRAPDIVGRLGTGRSGRGWVLKTGEGLDGR